MDAGLPKPCPFRTGPSTGRRWCFVLIPCKISGKPLRPRSPVRTIGFSSSPEQRGDSGSGIYLPRALEAACRQMPPVFLLTARLKKAGFALFDVETFLVQPDLQDLFLCTAANIVPPLPRSRRARRHLHLRHPGREEGIRTGLECLGADIGSGRIDQVRDRFDSDQGDSLFSSRKRKTEEVGGFEPRVSRPARRGRLVSLGDFRSDVLRGRVTYFKIRFTHQIMNAIRQKALYICKYRSYRTTNRR